MENTDDDRKKRDVRWVAARRLQAWVQQNPVSQVEVAEALSVTQGMVSRIMKGRVPLSHNLYEKAARLMGLPIRDLLAPEDESMWTPKEAELVGELHELAETDREEVFEILEVKLEQVRRRRAIRSSSKPESGRGAKG